MRVSDILRKLADVVDREERPTVDAQDENDLNVSTDPAMISPLQQNLELLKKANGVDNVFDNEEEEESDSSQGIDRLKKLAGIFAANTDSDVK
jgi:hypothetical protein